jgi:hypothetical protein
MFKSDLASLAKVLLDKSAPLADRDDAAMDLGAYNDDVALEVLIKVARDPTEDEMILSSCGTSIADIWYARGEGNREVLDSLTKEARNEVYIDPETFQKPQR